MSALSGVRVVEFAGLAPVPYCGMLLADLGADVVRIDRSPTHFRNSDSRPADPLSRGKRSIGVDLKHPGGVAAVLTLLDTADALVEPFRPGVMERLGLGPDVVLSRNPRLVYARLTGWGQDGPYARMAGHDIDYIALGGALGAIGRRGKRPVPPVNLVGDFAGGGLWCAFGIVAALYERTASGQGQVLDAAMVDGTASLMAMLFGMHRSGLWSTEHGTNLLDTGAPFYDTYRCADGRFVAVGAIEPQFYAALLGGLGLDPAELPDQMDRDRWDETRAVFAARFAERGRDEWQATFDGTDACVAPVLRMDEILAHPHNAARGVLVDGPDGNLQAAPGPRLGRSAPTITGPAPVPGEHTDTILAETGLDAHTIAKLRAVGAVG